MTQLARVPNLAVPALRRLAVPALAVLLSVAAAAPASWAQEPQGRPAEPPAAEPAPGAVAEPAGGGEPGYYLGVGTCLGSGCHGATRPQAEREVLGNEYYTWLREDPHQGAYNVLFNDTSRLIARNMGLDRPPHQAAACLACHATHVPGDRKRGPLEVKDGISCESCHGPASGWRDAHTEPGWSHEQSVERGLTDLRRAPVRARLCLGCHLGDPARTVDHALLAAGHPQLIFELDNYSQSMPPHWKPERTRAVHAWAVGQITAFQEGLRQLARQARGPHWPEFSAMSCQACHHSLAEGKWRQQRGYAGRVRPGQPPWSPDRWAALKHLLATVAPGQVEALGGRVRTLATAVERMGRPDEVAAAADGLADVLEAVTPAVAAADWNDLRARELIQAMAADRAFLLSADLASAEQIFFAAQTLAGHLLAGDPRLLRGEIPRALNRLYGALQDPDRYDPTRFADLLAQLGRAVGG